MVYNCADESPMLRIERNVIERLFTTSSHEMNGLRLNHPNRVTIWCGLRFMIRISYTIDVGMGLNYTRVLWRTLAWLSCSEIGLILK
jgi:hypothetical protein